MLKSSKSNQPMKFSGFGLIQNQDKDSLSRKITREADLFKVWHLGIPGINNREWMLSINGMVDRPNQFSLEDLKAFPQTSVMAFHECAGNPLYPKVPQRRVGNVVWKGVRLADLFSMVGVKEEACFVISKGFDQGIYNQKYYAEYEKDLPLTKALNPNVLIALEINDEPLTVDRGGPVRLVVPGYYGTNSTKWLTHLIVSDTRSKSDFTTKYYVDREVVDGQPKESPVWAVSPNSMIVHPQNGQLVKQEVLDIFGWTWAENPIVSVEVSTDGGENWQEAIVEARKNVEWQKFSFRWLPKSAGEYLIIARAFDSLGNCQPLTSRRNQVSRAMIFVQNSLDEKDIHPNID